MIFEFVVGVPVPSPFRYGSEPVTTRFRKIVGECVVYVPVPTRFRHGYDRVPTLPLRTVSSIFGLEKDDVTPFWKPTSESEFANLVEGFQTRRRATSKTTSYVVISTNQIDASKRRDVIFFQSKNRLPVPTRFPPGTNTTNAHRSS